MLLPCPGALLALALLAGSAEAADPPLVSTCADMPRVDLTADYTGQAAALCVTAGEPTTFVFEAPLPTGAVVVSDSHSMGFAQGDEFVTVYPKRSFLAGERVKLTVNFKDGAAPGSASFWLVGHEARGARRVEVFRHPRQADAFKREAAEAQARARQCQEDKTRLLAEREEPGGLMGTAWLERNNLVSSRDLKGQLKPHPTNALRLEKAWIYMHPGDDRPTGETGTVSVAVRVRLYNPSVEPWTASGAALVDSMGGQVEMTTWQAAPILPSSEGVLVLGSTDGLGQVACPCTIKLWEEQGMRSVALGNVTFPPKP